MCNLRSANMLTVILTSAFFAKVLTEPQNLCTDPQSCEGSSADDQSLLQIHSPRTWLQKDPAAVQSYAKCSLDSSDCSLDSMKGKPTLVYPGGETKCFNGDAYAFAVVPGDADKLAFFFEGGGACWAGYGGMAILQCTSGMADGIRTTGLGVGIQNSSKASNPFKSFTIIEPIYCSGDAFIGNTTLPDGETTYEQRGFSNALAAMDWAKNNFKEELTSLAIMGFSAGTLGTMAWAGELLGSFQHQKAVVIMDSYAGVFPPGTISRTMKTWGACGVGFQSAYLKSKCGAGEDVTIQGMVEEAMQKFPDVAFSSIQSKVDAAQIWFYQGMAQSWGMTTEMGITGEQFYEKTNAVYEHFVETNPNYVSYYVDGDRHTFLDFEGFYTASTAGPDAGAPAGQPPLSQWVSDLLALKPQTTSQCNGSPKSNNAESLDYCDEALESEAR
mmetsp:Transcript_79889/g.193589  ORF Transcript_79889/g.193589 Transcript_79889/m.193589 type:complete len:442 (-) Transcript_79889:106-1431(-)